MIENQLILYRDQILQKVAIKYKSEIINDLLYSYGVNNIA